MTLPPRYLKTAQSSKIDLNASVSAQSHAQEHDGFGWGSGGRLEQPASDVAG